MNPRRRDLLVLAPAVVLLPAASPASAGAVNSRDGGAFEAGAAIDAGCVAAAAQNLAAIQRYADAWATKRVDALLEPFAADAVFEDLGIEQVFRGREAMAAFFRDNLVAFPDFRIEIVSAVCDAHSGGSQWVMSGTNLGGFPGMPATGRSFRVRGASALRFQDARITSQTDYWSLPQMMRQISGSGTASDE